MLKRIQRLMRTWYGAFMERVAGDDTAAEESSAAEAKETRPEGEPTEQDLDARYEQLESRRLVEEIRRGGGEGTPPPPAEPGPVEKTVGPAPAAEPPVEKTIGPKDWPEKKA